MKKIQNKHPPNYFAIERLMSIKEKCRQSEEDKAHGKWKRVYSHT